VHVERESCRADAPADAPADVAGDAPLCPKCGAAYRGDASACPACGLAVARMAAYADARDARDAAVPEPVRAAWAHATAGWSDAARHEALLQLVVTYNAYAWAAGRYRARGRDPVAQHQLDRLRRATEAALLAGATVRRAQARQSHPATVGVLAALIVAIAIGLGYAIVVRDHPSAGEQPIPARSLTPGHPISPSTVK
jgi:hypothetical protein